MAAKKTRPPAKPKHKKTQPQAAYFLSLSLSNLRCFGPEQTISFTDSHGKPARWTLILGNNGVGKTTILEALVCMSPCRAYPGYPQLDFWTPRFVQDMSLGRILVSRNAQKAHLRELIAVGDRAIIKHANFTSVAFPVELSDRSMVWEEAEGLGTDFICFAYGATRRMGSGALTEASTDDPTATLFSDDRTLRNAEEWLAQTDYAIAKANGNRKAAEARFDKIKETLKAILPGIDDLRIVIDEKQSQPRPRVEAHTADGWVPLRSLSLGYRTMFAWMVDLASRLFERYPDSKNPLAEPAVVLVDEIDLHLHPSWQRQLMGYLTERFPNTQFIATAHSPLVVQAASDANIVVLKRVGDHVEIRSDMEAVRSWRVDQILTSELFDLPSAHPPAQDDLRRRREQILSKSKLAKKDKQELHEIESRIEAVSSGESRQDMEAMDIIRRAARRLKESDPKQP